MTRSSLYLARALLLICLASTSNFANAQENFGSFSDARARILNILGSANSRIWLLSEYLTDGEIVATLNVARFRRVDVQVLLDRRKARAYMSRLRFLKREKIPVFLKPGDFPFRDATMFLADNELYTFDAGLDFMDKRSSFSLKKASAAAKEKYMAAFVQAANLAIQAVPRPVPLVGKPRHNNSGRTTSTWRPKPKPVYQPGVYNYDLSPKQRVAPSGVPRRLPKRTISQERHDRTHVATPRPAPRLPRDSSVRALSPKHRESE